MTGLARGGCETNALCVISASRNYAHEVLVLGDDTEMQPEFVQAGAKVTFLKMISAWPWRLSRNIQTACRNLTPDAVICWHGMVCLPQILHALRDSGLPIVVHGGNPAYSMPAWVDWRYFALEKCLGKRAGATYACCSQHVADSFQRSLYLRRFPVKVIPNGVKSFQGATRGDNPGKSQARLKIGMVARLDAIKDHVTLLHAFAELQKDYPRVELEIVGDGFLRHDLEVLAARLGIAERTLFLGQVTDVYAVISEWDIFCYATTAQEGLGNALIEAMTAGLPCVATDVGPIKEIAGSPPVMKLVRPADPQALSAGLAELLQDSKLRQDLADAGQRRAQHEFSPEVFAGRYVKLLFQDRVSNEPTPC